MQNKLEVLDYAINNEADLDHCIQKLKNKEFIDCCLAFKLTTPSEDKLILLENCLKSQTKLKRLQLSAQLTEDDEKKLGFFILRGLSHLTGLQTLSLRGFLAKDNIYMLANFLNKLPCLLNLDLGICGFFSAKSIEGIEFLAEALKKNEVLISLDLSHSNLSRDAALTIANAMIFNKNIKKLDLRGNKLNRYEADILELLKDNQSLDEIIIMNTVITPAEFQRWIRTEQDLEQIFWFLKKSNNKTDLHITLLNYELSVDQLERLISTIKEMTAIKLLNFSGFSREHFAILHDKLLKNHPTITNLSFSVSGYLDNKSANLLTDLIQNNSRLSAISVTSKKKEFNFKLSSSSVSNIFKAIETSKSLIFFELSHQVFENFDNAARDVASMLSKNKSLQSLTLANNWITKNHFAINHILSSLKDNKTLRILDLHDNSGIISDALLIPLRQNLNLTQLYLSDPPGFSNLIIGPDFKNQIPEETEIAIIEFIARNLGFQAMKLYQKFVLMVNLDAQVYPPEIIKICLTYLVKLFDQVELRQFSTIIKERPHLSLMANYKKNSEEESTNERVNHFKRIYRALYQGQSSCLKHWNLLVDKENLTSMEIESYIEKNKNSRTEKAWQLAADYQNTSDDQELFKEVHQYAFSNSSNFFGFFKRSLNFTENYENYKMRIANAEEGSRTKVIADSLGL